ncbi:MAG: hypothetical protein HGA86_07705, partial [Anaerolineaceae bacterium]|nr:hypothetical protein [Anaerolineaceae bacterium]
MKFLKKRILSSVILITILLAACNSAVISPTSTPSLPAPVVNTTQVPDSQKAVTEFLELWKKEDYSAMYDRLNQVSRDAIPLEDFIKKYKDAAISLTMQTLDYQIQSVLTEISKAQVAYTIVYRTALFQDIKTSTEMMLTLESGAWKVQWDDAIIFAELKGGNRLSLDAKVPSRGNIYDRNGQILAGQTEAYAIGIVPGEIN